MPAEVCEPILNASTATGSFCSSGIVSYSNTHGSPQTVMVIVHNVDTGHHYSPVLETTGQCIPMDNVKSTRLFKL